MYLLLNNGQIDQYPYSVYDLKKDNPNTSFPASLTDQKLAEYGVYPVKPSEPPTSDYTQNLVEDDPVLEDGEWVQAWKVETATQSEKTERLEAAWAYLREERNRRLTESDWTQLEDAPVNKETWAAYRMALRFLPEATQDPFNPVWPVKPS